MAMPPEVDLRLPILELLAEGGGTREIAEVTRLMADLFGLDDRERAERHAVSGRPKFGMRVRHAVSHLRIAAFLSNTEPGTFAIAPPGRAALLRRPARITDRFLLANSPEYRMHRDARSRKKRALGSGAGAPAETEGLVAILDMPGAGGSGDPARTRREWRGLLAAARALLDCSEPLRGRCTMSAFSGTMFVTAAATAAAGAAGGGRRGGGAAAPSAADLLLGFGDVAWRLVVKSISGDVPVRGCVSYGRYSGGDQNLLIGRAVDEAARYHSLPQWIGVSAAPSANSVLSRTIRRGPDPHNRFAKYDVPLASSVERDAWAVNWPWQCDNEEHGEAAENVLGAIDSKLDTMIDIDAAIRWRNTRKFCTDMLAA